MSANVGSVKVSANLEHLLEDLTNRRQRVEPALLHLDEEAPKRGVVLHGLLEVAPSTDRRNLEHLAREVSAAAALELAIHLEPGVVLRDRGPERVNPLAGDRFGQHHLR